MALDRGQQVGRKAQVWLNQSDISGDLTEVTVDLSVDIPDVTALGDSHRQRKSGGLKDWAVTHTGFFNDTTTAGSPGIEELLKTQLSASGIFGVYWAGTGPSQMGYEGIYPTVNYSINIPLAGMVALSADYSGSGELVRAFITGSPSTSGCTATASANGSIDLGASKGVVCYGFLRVQAGSATTSPSLAVVLQHSGDDSSWTDLITFTVAAACTFEVVRVTSASRYIREQHNISDGGGNNAEYTWMSDFGYALGA